MIPDRTQKSTNKIILAFSLMFCIISIAFFYLSVNSSYPNMQILPFTRNYIQAAHVDVEFKIIKNNITIANMTCANTNGASMQPSFFNGNIICYKPFNHDELRQGQIIVYKDQHNQTISHRIKTLLSNERVIVQGDNNKPHETISHSRIEGIVALIILA